MQGFLGSVVELVKIASPSDIHEVGCGEGLLSIHLSGQAMRIRGSDFSEQVIEKARKNATGAGASIEFKAADLYAFDPEKDAASMIICCEVLEHLEEPGRAMEMLCRVARPHLLVSVPREPIWRILNLMRGQLHDTPGHIQHWSKTGFLSFLERYVEVVEVRTPLPWTIALCRTRG